MRITANGDDTQRAINHPDYTVRMRLLDFRNNRASFPHVNAAVELAGQSLAGGEKRDAQHLLRGADLAEEAVGALQRVAVPELCVLVAHRHELVAGSVGVEAAGVHVRHVRVGLTQSDSSPPVIENCGGTCERA